MVFLSTTKVKNAKIVDRPVDQKCRTIIKSEISVATFHVSRNARVRSTRVPALTRNERVEFSIHYTDTNEVLLKRYGRAEPDR